MKNGITSINQTILVQKGEPCDGELRRAHGRRFERIRQVLEHPFPGNRFAIDTGFRSLVPGNGRLATGHWIPVNKGEGGQII